jgi:hypothetical protein
MGRNSQATSAGDESPAQKARAGANETSWFEWSRRVAEVSDGNRACGKRRRRFAVGKTTGGEQSTHLKITDCQPCGARLANRVQRPEKRARVDRFERSHVGASLCKNETVLGASFGREGGMSARDGLRGIRAIESFARGDVDGAFDGLVVCSKANERSDVKSDATPRHVPF